MPPSTAWSTVALQLLEAAPSALSQKALHTWVSASCQDTPSLVTAARTLVTPPQVCLPTTSSDKIPTAYHPSIKTSHTDPSACHQALPNLGRENQYQHLPAVTAAAASIATNVRHPSCSLQSTAPTVARRATSHQRTLLQKLWSPRVVHLRLPLTRWKEAKVVRNSSFLYRDLRFYLLV